MEAVNLLMRTYLKARLPALKNALKDPVRFQQMELEHLLKVLPETAFGKSRGFTSGMGREAFEAMIPLTDYSEMKSLAEQQFASPDRSVLWKAPIRYAARSSGTSSGKSKYLPLSQEMIRHNHLKGGKDASAWYYHHRPEAAYFGGKSLLVGGSRQPSPYPGIWCGDVSAILMHQLPAWLQFFRAPSLELALNPDWEQKLNRMAEEVARQDIRSISGVPSWTLLVLQKVLERSGRSSLKAVWPKLEVCFHGGVEFEPYRQAFFNLAGPELKTVNIYNASEGFFGFSDLGSDELYLHPDAGFFAEFIDESERICSWENLVQGKMYELVVSSRAGLWRYRMGDLMEIVATNPLKFRICGRKTGFLNAFGEEVTEEQIKRIVQEAEQRMNLRLNAYSVGAVHEQASGRGYHHWFIEPGEGIVDADGFINFADSRLKELNSDYEAKRTAGLLMEHPRLSVLMPGDFYRWMGSEGRLGGQNKIPIVMNSERLRRFNKFVNE